MSAGQTVLGGDEVGAIVVDCGSWVTRVGSAGDDTPRSIVPSAVGTRPPPKPAEPTDAMTDDDPPPVLPQIGVGDRVLTAPLAFTDIHSLYGFDEMGRGTVRDWDGMQKIWEASCQTLRLTPNNSPFLIVEPARGWDEPSRAKALERAFEGLGVPAAYLARGSTMAAFASARTTACVVDVGHQGAVAVPIVDGFMLKKSIMGTKVGGLYLSEKLKEWTEAELRGRDDYDGGVYDHKVKGGRLRAHHEIKRERLPSDGETRIYKTLDLVGTERVKALSEGHSAFYRLKVIEEMKAHTLRVSQGKTVANEEGSVAGKEPAKGNVNGDAKAQAKEGGGDEKESAEKDSVGANGSSSKQGQARDKGSASTQTTEYVLPDGNAVSLREEQSNLFAGELFTSSGTDKVSLPELVFRAVSICDVDVRRDLFGGVVLTGGTSLISGTLERFTRELAVRTPQMYKLKVLAATNGIERSCGAWIGGSILASLGTFQQVWVSKAEYEELGSQGALRKCP